MPGAETLAQLGQAAGGSGQGIQGFTQSLLNIFGSETDVKGNQTEQLQIDPKGVEKIIRDILSSTQGLAAIFNEENISGLYSSSVSAQASGNLLANLAGEIAKLTAKKVTTSNQSQDDGGALSGIEGVVGSIGGEIGRLGKKLGF